MNEVNIRDIYYVEHKWNPHFFYLSPKSFCQDLEKNGSDLYLDLFHAMYQEESDYICPYTENDFSLRKELCNNGTTIIYQIITPSPVLSPLTRCVYLCCQLDKQQYFYYTSELTHTGDYLLCGWTKDEAHLIFHSDASTLEEELEEVKKLFKEVELYERCSDRLQGLCKRKSSLPSRRKNASRRTYLGRRNALYN